MVSQYFEAGDLVLWNPATRVAQVFARVAEALVPLAGVPSGIGPEQSDEYKIDAAGLSAFVDALVVQYEMSSHPVMRSMLDGFLSTAIVLVERAGGTVSSLAAGHALRTLGADLMGLPPEP